MTTTTIAVNRNEEKTIVVIKGQLTFGQHKEFRNAYQQDIASVTEESWKKREFIIDMAGVEYIDSSALGMLLVLRDELKSDKMEIKIVSARPTIRKILEVAKFDTLFTII